MIFSSAAARAFLALAAVLYCGRAAGGCDVVAQIMDHLRGGAAPLRRAIDSTCFDSVIR
jgi:hypothetical protein